MPVPLSDPALEKCRQALFTQPAQSDAADAGENAGPTGSPPRPPPQSTAS